MKKIFKYSPFNSMLSTSTRRYLDVPSFVTIAITAVKSKVHKVFISFESFDSYLNM